MNLIQQRLNGLAEQLLQELEAAGNIPHDLTVGNIREAAIRNSIRRFIPEKLGICSGFVTDANGTITPQLDIILFRREALSPFFFEGEAAIVPFETFGLAIEVKSTLKKEDLDGQIKRQIDALSEMVDTTCIPSSGVNGCRGQFKLTVPRLYIFAYNTVIKIDALEEFQKKNPILQGITVIKKCHIVNGKDIPGRDERERIFKFWTLLFYIAIAVQNRKLSKEEDEKLERERQRICSWMPQEFFKMLTLTPSLEAYLINEDKNKM